MDFKKLKEKALELKNKASEKTNEAIDYSAKKLSESKFTISKKEDLDKLIKKSKNTKFKNKETWEEKEYKHKSIVIFADEKSSFYKDALYILPVIVTKAFTQNIEVKLAKTKIEWLDLKEYKIDEKELASMIVFENEKIYKQINWKENILKLVKSFNLDINKQIDNI